MNQKQYVVHNRGLSQILFATPWSVRSVFKHVIVVAFIAFITVIAFDFNAFKDAVEGVATGKNGISIVETAKLQAPQIAWDILLIFLEIRILRRTLKMIQTSNRNMWVFIPFALIAIGLGAFIAIFLPGWMEDKIALEKDFVDGFKMLSVFMYIYMIVPGLTIVWSIANAINERRISPFVARANVLTSINMVLWLSTIGCLAGLAEMIFLGDTTVPFDIHSTLQFFLIVLAVILLIVTIISSIWSQHDMRRKTNYKFFNKNIGQAISVALVLPLIIWLCSSFISMNGVWMEYLYIVIVALASGSCVAYAFIRRTESGSPRVFMVIASLTLAIIWMGKFFFEYFWGYRVTSMFTLPVAMIGTGIIVSIIYWKSPMTSKLIQFIFARFIKIVWIVVVASWAVALVPTIAPTFPELEETLNLMLMALPIVLLVITLLYWYITQWKIKSHIDYTRKKNRHLKNQKKKSQKEAVNA